MNARIVCAALLLAGCATGGYAAMDSIISSWLGEHIETAVDQWGMPNREDKIAGRSIYVWDGGTTYVTISQSSAIGWKTAPTTAAAQSTTFAAGSPMSCTRMLEVDDKGIVTAGGYRGNNCCFATIAGHCKAWLNPRRQ